MENLIRAAQSGEVGGEVYFVYCNRRNAPAVEKARRLGVPVVEVFPFKPSNFSRLYSLAERVELICLAGFMKLLPGDFLKNLRVPVLNVHPSLLPAFPGLDAQRQALDYGVKVSGATIHFVDETLDGGPIVLQEPVEVCDDDTVESLSERILKVEHRLYRKAVRLFFEGRLEVKGRRVYITEEVQNG